MKWMARLQAFSHQFRVKQTGRGKEGGRQRETKHMSAAFTHYSYGPCAPCRYWQLGKAALIFSLRAVICVVNVKERKGKATANYAILKRNFPGIRRIYILEIKAIYLR